MILVAGPWILSQLAQLPELLLDLPQDLCRHGLELSPQRRLSIDRLWSIMTSQSSALPAVPWADRRASVLADQPRRAGQHPRGRMSGLVQQVALDHQDWSDLARLGAITRAQVRKVKCAVRRSHDSSRPSLARWSNSSSSTLVLSRTASDASAYAFLSAWRSVVSLRRCRPLRTPRLYLPAAAFERFHQPKLIRRQRDTGLGIRFHTLFIPHSRAVVNVKPTVPCIGMSAFPLFVRCVIRRYWPGGVGADGSASGRGSSAGVPGA